MHIVLLDWEQAEPVAAPIRFAIFMQEKQPDGVELDQRDKESVHAVAYNEAGKAIGTARLLPDGEIGRMAVLKEWRRRGVGIALLEALITEARRRGHHEVTMNVPLQAAEFYRGQGFSGEGKVQKVGELLQQRMRRSL